MTNTVNANDSFILHRPLVNKLLHFAQASPEREVCALIGVDQQQNYSFYPVPNCAATPARRFEMDPQAQIAALRDMRERDRKLFAIVHSHPASTAEPSTTDADAIGYPEALYLIISLNTRGVLEMRAYQLDEGSRTFHEKPLLMQQ